MKRASTPRTIAERNGHTSAATSLTPDLSATVEEFPALSDEDQAALAEFWARQQVIRDLVIGCIAGSHTGASITGPAGVSKTYTVLGTLRERGAYFQYHQRITAKPLYLEFEKHPGAVHVIDDNEQLYNEKAALTLLRSALGGERINGRRERRVSYSVAGSHARVLSHYFYGAIIFLGNRPLSDEKPELRAVMSRIPCVNYSPSDREIRALMRHVARQGFVGDAGSMNPHECIEVVEHIIQLASELECRLDLRWIEHGYGHYLTHVASGGSVDWRDMAKFHIMNTLTCFDHSSSTKLAREADRRQGNPGPTTTSPHGAATGELTLEEEVAIAREIAATAGLTQAERVRQWEERTKLSKATYYRRKG